MSLGLQLGRLLEEGVAAEEAAAMLGINGGVAKLESAPEPDFSDADLQDALNGIATIARSGEHERNRLTASVFIVEVKKKLRVSKAPEAQNNITLIQQLITAANDDVNQFARSLSARDGRRDPVAIEEPRQAGEGAQPQLAGSGLARATPDQTAPNEPPGPNFESAEFSQPGPEPQIPTRV